MRTLEALGARMLVVRHPRSGAPQLASGYFSGHVLNAGDGWHAHPSQALLDLFTLREVLGDERLDGARVAIMGDVLHSRVARSDIWALTCWGVDLRITGPTVFLRGFDAWARALPADRRLHVTGDLATAIGGADAVMALRVQRERLEGAGAPSEAAYAARWGITKERLMRHAPGAIVMHPGPVNEGVELPPDVVSGPRSVITRQVANGVPVRMAAMARSRPSSRRQPRWLRVRGHHGGHTAARRPTGDGPAGARVRSGDRVGGAGPPLGALGRERKVRAVRPARMSRGDPSSVNNVSGTTPSRGGHAVSGQGRPCSPARAGRASRPADWQAHRVEP